MSTSRSRLISSSASDSSYGVAIAELPNPVVPSASREVCRVQLEPLSLVEVADPLGIAFRRGQESGVGRTVLSGARKLCSVSPRPTSRPIAASADFTGSRQRGEAVRTAFEIPRIAGEALVASITVHCDGHVLPCELRQIETRDGRRVGERLGVVPNEDGAALRSRSARSGTHGGQCRKSAATSRGVRGLVVALGAKADRKRAHPPAFASPSRQRPHSKSTPPERKAPSGTSLRSRSDVASSSAARICSCASCSSAIVFRCYESFQYRSMRTRPSCHTSVCAGGSFRRAANALCG